MYANLYVLNKMREARGLNTFNFRPHAGGWARGGAARERCGGCGPLHSKRCRRGCIGPTRAYTHTHTHTHSLYYEN